MRTLLLRYSLKHHLVQKFRLAMVILSLALGVAIFVSSYESIAAAKDSIQASATALKGKVEWKVSKGRYLGVEESLVAKIRAIPGAIAAPVIESSTAAGPPLNRSFLLVGVDMQSDAMAKLYGGDLASGMAPAFIAAFLGGGMIVPFAFAEQNGLKPGSVIQLQGKVERHDVTIAGAVDVKQLKAIAGGSVGLMDLHSAQTVLGMPGMVDRIDVAGVSKADLQKACPDCQLDSPKRMNSAGDDAISRIRSLLGVSVIALLVGVLLIYNSVQVSILERLKDIAIIRAIGATRIQIFGFLLIEWLIIGTFGSALGIVLGSALASALVDYTKKSINTMVPLMADAHVHVGPKLVVIGMAIGVATTLVAAFFPIWTAANVRPLAILRPYTYRRSHRYGLAAIIGVVSCALGNLIIATMSVSWMTGLAVIGLVFLGVALLFPQLILMLANACRPWLRRTKRPEPYLALDGLLKTPHRTAFTIMTFGTALAMMVATETLVQGFRVSTGQWMNAAFPFDISVIGNDLTSSLYGNQALPTSLLTDLVKVPGVGHVYGVRKLMTPMNGQDTMVLGVDTVGFMEARKAKGMGAWPPGIDDAGVQKAFKAGEITYVSTNFAKLYRKHAGETLTVQTPTGSVSFRIQAVVDDYSWAHGCFIVDRAILRKDWHDDSLSYVDVGVAPGQSVDEVKGRISKVAASNRAAFAYNRKEITDVTDSILEQAVAMANMQAAIAVLIGMMGIVNAIWIGVMNRKKEIALWRSIGMTRRQIRGIILFEGLFVSIVAGFMGAFGGLYGGWIPLRSFSFDITGYIYPMVVPWAQIWEVGALALVLGLSAGLLPAHHAAKLPILESIGYE